MKKPYIFYLLVFFILPCFYAQEAYATDSDYFRSVAEQTLFEAVKENNIEKIKTLWTSLSEAYSNISINDISGEKGKNNPNILNYAITNNSNAQTINLLLDLGADPNGKKGEGIKSPLALAIKKNKEDLVMLLLGHTVTLPNDKEGQPLLLPIAIEKGWGKVVSFLLEEKGATITADLFCQVRFPITLRLILKKYPSLVNEPDSEYGRTPLHWAACRGDTAIMKTLLENGALKDKKDKNRETPLQLFEREGIHKINKNHIESAYSHLQPNKNEKEKLIEELFNAVLDNNTEEIKRLWSTLQAEPYKIKNIDELVPPTKFMIYKNILEYAAYYSKPETISFLIQTLKANLKTDPYAFLLINKAIEAGKVENIAPLIENNGEMVENNYRHAVRKMSLQTLQSLLQKYPFKGDPMKLLIEAISAEKLDNLQFLLSQYPDLIKEKNDGDHQTLLHYAARYENKAIIEFLLKQGADKTIKDKAGATARDIIVAKINKTGELFNRNYTEILNVFDADTSAAVKNNSSRVMPPQPPQAGNHEDAKKAGLLCLAAIALLAAGRYVRKEYKLYSLKKEILGLKKKLKYHLIEKKDYDEKYVDLISKLSPQEAQEVEEYVELRNPSF